jgi:hypothetical protein
VPIYLSSTGRLLADPATPAALAVVDRVGAAIAVVRPPLPQQPGHHYEPRYSPHALLLRRWCRLLRPVRW